MRSFGYRTSAKSLSFHALLGEKARVRAVVLLAFHLLHFAGVYQIGEV
jgi:hypothetical protein